MIKNLLFHTKKWLIIPIIGNKNALKQLYSYDFIQLSLSQPYSLVLSWAPIRKHRSILRKSTDAFVFQLYSKKYGTMFLCRIKNHGGEYEIRTRDLLHAMQAL